MACCSAPTATPPTPTTMLAPRPGSGVRTG
ncbi:hypothetical protein [Streptomyces sp. Caat 7-52]